MLIFNIKQTKSVTSRTYLIYKIFIEAELKVIIMRIGNRKHCSVNNNMDFYLISLQNKI